MNFKLIDIKDNYLMGRWDLNPDEVGAPCDVLPYRHFTFHVKPQDGGCVKILGSLIPNSFDPICDDVEGMQLEFSQPEIRSCSEDVKEIAPVAKGGRGKAVIVMMARK